MKEKYGTAGQHNYSQVSERLKHKARRAASINAQVQKDAFSDEGERLFDVTQEERARKARAAFVRAKNRSEVRFYKHDDTWRAQHPQAKLYFDASGFNPTKQNIKKDTQSNIPRYPLD